MNIQFKIVWVLIFCMVCGVSIKAFAQADVAVLMQKMQELENKLSETEKKLREVEKKETSLPGEIKESLLTPEAFQKKYGKVWVLMAGQNISDFEKDIPNIDKKALGSDIIPDARGKFLRMSNNGKTCADKWNCEFNTDEVALGKYQEDSFKTHAHKVFNRSEFKFNPGEQKASQPSGEMQTSPEGGSETRPKNITVNFYIKIASCAGVTPCH